MIIEFLDIITLFKSLINTYGRHWPNLEQLELHVKVEDEFKTGLSFGFD